MEEKIKSKITACKINKRNLIIMKLSSLLFFICIFSLTAENVHSQQKEISVKLKNSKIVDVISVVEKVSDYVFLISDEAKSELNRKTSINVDKKSINAILDIILKGTALEYSVVERQISLYRSKERANQTTELKTENIEQQKKQVQSL